MKRYLAYLCIIIFAIGCRTTKIAQYEKINQITFIKQSFVSNYELFDLSIVKFQNDMRSTILSEREDEPETDTVLLNKMIEMLGSQLYSEFADNSEIYNHFTLQGSLIISYKEIDGKIIGDYTVINRNNDATYQLAKKDSTFKYGEVQYPYNRNKIDILEYRDSINVIEGYKCFKVSFIDVEEIDEENSVVVQTKYDLYVTEEIPIRFHPNFKYLEVLNRYFPLKIIMRDNFVEGTYTEYRVKLQ